MFKSFRCWNLSKVARIELPLSISMGFGHSLTDRLDLIELILRHTSTMIVHHLDYHHKEQERVHGFSLRIYFEVINLETSSWVWAIESSTNYLYVVYAE